MKQLSNNDGYTLIEMIVVLAILSTIVGISLVSFQSLSTSLNEKNFLSKLENELYFCQQYAISTGRQTNCFIDNNQKVIAIRQTGKILFQYSFDPSVSFERGTLGLHEIEFNPKGNIRKSGTVFINVNNNTYRLVFWIGRGRFHIEKV